VRRLRGAGYLDWTPDRAAEPGARFFERRLGTLHVQGRACPRPRDLGWPIDLITIDDYMVKIPSKTALVRVKGDSMIAKRHPRGDLLVVEQQPMRTSARSSWRSSTTSSP
jgi:hypothetical protein